MQLTRRGVLRYAIAAASLAALGPARAAAPTAAPRIPLSGNDPVALLDAWGQAELIRRGEATPLELVDAAIGRIESLNRELGAVVEERFERARAEARQLAPGLGALRGVPTLVQDVAIAGERLDLGSRVLALVDQRPQVSDDLYQRMRRAGMIVLGRTNMAAVGMAPTTESRLGGPARNPWDPQRSTGGAAGGAAAAVASLMVPVAQASDDLGGLRLPAGATGIIGFKPSRGRISAAPNSAEWVDIATTRGWIGRSVRDIATLLDFSSGSSPTDSFAAPLPMGNYSALLTRSPGKLRIGMMTSIPGHAGAIEPAARIAVESTARLLSDLGHRVEVAMPAPFASSEHVDILARYQPLAVARRLAAAERALGRPLGEYDLEPEIYALYRRAQETSVAEFAAVLTQAQHYSRRVLGWWQEGFDLLICPTAGCVAPPLGALTNWGDEATLRLHAQWSGFLPMMNLTGQPVITLPLHWSEAPQSNGAELPNAAKQPNGAQLPVGVQLVADLWCEDLLLQLATELERLRPWAHRLPPLHA